MINLAVEGKNDKSVIDGPIKKSVETGSKDINSEWASVPLSDTRCLSIREG